MFLTKITYWYLNSYWRGNKYDETCRHMPCAKVHDITHSGLLKYAILQTIIINAFIYLGISFTEMLRVVY